MSEALLKNTTLMPLRELKAVDHTSGVYNEGDRRGVFYAESWALMHYLMLGNPIRTTQLRDYLLRVKNRVAPEQAMRVAGATVQSLTRVLLKFFEIWVVGSPARR